MFSFSLTEFIRILIGSTLDAVFRCLRVGPRKVKTPPENLSEDE